MNGHQRPSALKPMAELSLFSSANGELALTRNEPPQIATSITPVAIAAATTPKVAGTLGTMARVSSGLTTPKADVLTTKQVSQGSQQRDSSNNSAQRRAFKANFRNETELFSKPVSDAEFIRQQEGHEADKV